MFQDLDWESQESRREKIQLTLLFKVIQDLVDILTPASTRIRANHTKKLRQISSTSDAYKFSFFPEFFSSHCGGGPWLGILQTRALHSYILS